MTARTLAFKALSLLVIFVFLFSNTAVARAQQPDPATATPPAPYTDNNISGTVTQSNRRPAQGVTLDYDIGSMPVDSPFTLTGLAPGNYTLTPTKNGVDWSFSPSPMTGVPTGTTDADFNATPRTGIMLGGEPSAVAVQGDYLYVGGGGKLYVLNVQDKTSIALTTAYWISTDTITDVVVQGDNAYVVEGYGGLNILDISDPTDPQFVGLYADNLQYKSVAVSGHYAYLTCGTDLVVVDIQDPAKPSFVVDDYWSGNAAANRVLVDGNYAYLVGEQGLWVLDISDPTNPFIAATWESGSGNPIVDVAMYDGDLILTETAALYDLNDDDPTHPYQNVSVDLPDGGVAYRSTIVFDVLVVADGVNGLLTYDISQPWNDIPYYGAYKPAGSVTAVAEEDAYTYIINGASVRIVNVIDPTAPAAAGSYKPSP